MAFCGNCGNELREGAKFCPKCGTAANTHQEQQEAKGKRFSTPWIAAFTVLTILIGSYFVTDMVSPETHNKLFGWVSSDSSPKDIAVKSLEYIKKGDYAGFFNYVGTDETDGKDVVFGIGLLGMVMEKQKGISSYIIESEKIEGNNATVTAKITYGNGATESLEASYKKENDKWVTNKFFDIIGIDKMENELFE